MSVKPHHEALLKIMVVMSAADGRLRDHELNLIADLARNMPVFRSVTADDLVTATAAAKGLLGASNGIEGLIQQAASVLTRPLRETAYALAVEIAASDLKASDEELRLLEMLRDTLDIDPLMTTAIEASARARYRRDPFLAEG
jgi:tellurite resistance protein